MRKSGFYIIGLVTFLFLSSSCWLFKKNITKKHTLTLEQVYDSIYRHQQDYTSIKAKFGLKFQNSSKTVSLKGQLRLLTDSAIWISITPGLGIEAMRLMCTRDSIYLLDKINKSLTKGKYEYIKRLWKVDVDYNSLQAILTNKFFIYPIITEEKLDFKEQFTLKDDSSKYIAYRKTETSVENLIEVDNVNYLIVHYLINDVPNLRSMSVNYSKGNFEGLKNFPAKIDVSSTNSGKNILLNIDYTDVERNVEVSFPFKVPNSYHVIVH